MGAVISPHAVSLLGKDEKRPKRRSLHLVAALAFTLFVHYISLFGCIWPNLNPPKRNLDL